MERRSVAVDGVAASYLTAGTGPPVLLLHGTYWSLVWRPVVDLLAAGGLCPIAVDLKGCGRSEGDLDLVTGSVPGLTAWVERFVDALKLDEPLAVVGHDIGGAIAQRMVVRGRHRVDRIGLVNSVSYDSWPVPGVRRFRDPAVVAHTTTEEVVASRRLSLAKAVGRPLDPRETEEYLSPWRERRVARSWMALAGAADSRYTQELMAELRQSVVPMLLIWGEDDEFQPIAYAEQLSGELPDATLVRIPGAGHIPMENDPRRVAAALIAFVGSTR